MIKEQNLTRYTNYVHSNVTTTVKYTKYTSGYKYKDTWSTSWCYTFFLNLTPKLNSHEKVSLSIRVSNFYVEQEFTQHFLHKHQISIESFKILGIKFHIWLDGVCKEQIYTDKVKDFPTVSHLLPLSTQTCTHTRFKIFISSNIRNHK